MFGPGSHVDGADGHPAHRIDDLDARSGVADRDRTPVRRDRDPLPFASRGWSAAGWIDPVPDRRRALQRREQGAPRLRRIVDVHGFPRHQQRQLGIGFQTRTGGQASGIGERQRVGGSVPLGERQIADHERRHEQHRDADEEAAQPAVRSTRPNGLALGCVRLARRNSSFEVVQIRLMEFSPLPRRCESGSPIEIGGVTPSLVPHATTP